MTSEENPASTNPKPSTTTIVASEPPPAPSTLSLSPEQEQDQNKKEDENPTSSKGECCGVPKKRCVVVWTVFGLISILFLTWLSVFCYYFFDPGPIRLECPCDMQADGCKAISYNNRKIYDKIQPIYGTAKCKAGEECYIRQKDGESKPSFLCKKNPGHYICKKGKKTTECFCDTYLCFTNKNYQDGCYTPCKGVGKGQVKKKPGY